MKITFGKLRYFNFLSAGSGGIEIDLDSTQFTLITGKNGAGKSSAIDAITYVLFNKAYRDINLPLLVNTINGKKSLVEQEFTIGSTHYLVRRGAKPAVFEIHVNGVELHQDAANGDFQKYLEQNILGMNFKTFCQLVIIGKASYVPFMKLNKAARIERISDFLDILIFGKMSELAKQEVTASKQRLKDIETDYTLTKNKIDVQNSLVENLHVRHQKKITDNKTAIAELQDKIGTVEGNIQTLQNSIDALSEDISDFSDKSDKKEKLQELDRKLKFQKKTLVTEIEFFTDNCECPSCHQEISQDYGQEILDARILKKDELETALAKMGKTIQSVDARLDEIRGVTQQITKLNASIRDMQSEITADQRYIAKLLTELETASDDEEAIQVEREKLKDYAKSALEVSEKKHKELDEKAYLDMCVTLLKNDGIKTAVIREYLPILNKLIAKFLHQLDFFLTFELDESFDEVIRSRDRDSFTYNSFSQGEQCKLDLSLLFTFITVTQIKNTVSVNFCVFDEMLDSGLDQESSGMVMEIFKEHFPHKQIVIISHYPHLYEEYCERHIQFTKVGNYSAMEEKFT